MFLQADQAAVSVFSRIADWDSMIPPLFDMPGADEHLPLRQMVNHQVYDDAWVPDMLAGRTMDAAGRGKFDGDLLGSSPSSAVPGSGTRRNRRLVRSPTGTRSCTARSATVRHGSTSGS
ncbi:hypothetical protein [Actinocrispum sp. NPDC049592]|uniref:hypothetical protein n=1 Tax=Actinocrispum sp. NPDC049592 TaxID=3154835 RepID=UPI00342B0CE9